MSSTPFFAACGGDAPTSSRYHRNTSSSSVVTNYTGGGGSGDHHQGFSTVNVKLVKTKKEYDPREVEDVDEKHIVRQFEESIKIGIKPESFMWDPKTCHQDVATADEIRRMNGAAPDGKGHATWKDCLFPGAKAKHKEFHCRFPIPPFKSTGDIRFFDLTFSLPCESMTVAEFFDRIKDDDKTGSFSMKVSNENLKNGFGNEFCKEILVHKIEIVNQRNVLPVTFKGKLTSNRLGDESERMALGWSRPLGVHQHSSNMDKSQVYHHIIYPKQEIRGKHGETLFLANPNYNSSLFAEWVNVDGDRLLMELAEARDPLDPEYVKFDAPPVDSVEPSNMLQYVLLRYFKKVAAVSSSLDKTVPKCERPDSGSSRHVLTASYEAMKTVICSYLELVNRNATIMNMSDVTWTISYMNQNLVQWTEEMLDNRGNPVYEQKVDKDGNPVPDSQPIKKVIQRSTSQGHRDMMILSKLIRNAQRLDGDKDSFMYPQHSTTIRITGEPYHNPNHKHPSSLSSSSLASFDAPAFTAAPAASSYTAYPGFTLSNVGSSASTASFTQGLFD